MMVQGYLLSLVSGGLKESSEKYGQLEHGFVNKCKIVCRAWCSRSYISLLPGGLFETLVYTSI